MHGSTVCDYCADYTSHQQQAICRAGRAGAGGILIKAANKQRPARAAIACKSTPVDGESGDANGHYPGASV